MLRTLQAPPPKGSLQEWTLIFLLDRLEDIEHARFRALAQVLIDKESGVEAFEDYMRIAFPSMHQRKKKRDDGMKELLKSWTSKGPLQVIPLQEKRGTSRLKQRLVRVEDERLDNLYGKINRG